MKGAVVNRDNIWTRESHKEIRSQEGMLANISGIFRGLVCLNFSFRCLLCFASVAQCTSLEKPEQSDLKTAITSFLSCSEWCFVKLKIYVTICISAKLCFFGGIVKQLLFFRNTISSFFSSEEYTRVESSCDLVYRHFRISCVTHVPVSNQTETRIVNIH